jgi:hypothetical protein
LLGLFFYPDDGGRFLGNVTELLSDYMAPNSTIQTLLTFTTVRTSKSHRALLVEDGDQGFYTIPLLLD